MMQQIAPKSDEIYKKLIKKLESYPSAVPLDDIKVFIPDLGLLQLYKFSRLRNILLTIFSMI